MVTAMSETSAVLTLKTRGALPTARGTLIELSTMPNEPATHTTVSAEGFPIVDLATRRPVAGFFSRTTDVHEPRLLPKRAASRVLTSCVVTGFAPLPPKDDADHVAGLTAVLPVYTCPPDRLDELVSRLATGMFAPAAEGARSAQRIADAVYGRLEWPRALSWTVEELGELAQAQRQGLGDHRMLEELGQLYWWVHCLANIADIDLPTAAAIALDREEARQRSAYGDLRPYRAPGP